MSDRRRRKSIFDPNSKKKTLTFCRNTCCKSYRDSCIATNTCFWQIAVCVVLGKFRNLITKLTRILSILSVIRQATIQSINRTLLTNFKLCRQNGKNKHSLVKFSTNPKNVTEKLNQHLRMDEVGNNSNFDTFNGWRCKSIIRFNPLQRQQSTVLSHHQTRKIRKYATEKAEKKVHSSRANHSR